MSTELLASLAIKTDKSMILMLNINKLVIYRIFNKPLKCIKNHLQFILLFGEKSHKN